MSNRAKYACFSYEKQACDFKRGVSKMFNDVCQNPNKFMPRIFTGATFSLRIELRNTVL